MSLTIIRRSFWSWWENISYSLLSSFLGAINPFFLIVVATFMWSFTTDSKLMLEHPEFFIAMIGMSLAASPFFPTTLAAVSVQGKLLTEGSAGYFGFYLKELKRLFFRGLEYTLVFALAGLLLGFSVWFYHTQLDFIHPFNDVLAALSGWFYVVLLLMQFYLVPEVVYETEGLIANVAVAFLMLFRKLRLMLTAFFFSGFVVALMLLPAASRFTAVVPLVTVVGFRGVVFHWLYWLANDEVPPALQEEKKRSAGDIFSPFTALFRKGKKGKKN